MTIQAARSIIGLNIFSVAPHTEVSVTEEKIIMKSNDLLVTVG